MKIVCISDTHRQHGLLDIPDADMLIHAGDFSDWGAINDVIDFGDWLKYLPHKHKIVVAGNHDTCFESKPEMSKAALRGSCIYLNSDVVEIEGFKIYGTPYTPRFAGAFQLGYGAGEDDSAFWKTIVPDGIDILITHGPPFGILDSVADWEDGLEARHCGSQGLLERVIKVKPKLHVFGHIHESYGFIKQRYGIFMCSIGYYI